MGERASEVLLLTCDEPALKEYVRMMCQLKKIDGLSVFNQMDEDPRRMLLTFDGQADQAAVRQKLQALLDEWHDKNSFHVASARELYRVAAKAVGILKRKQGARERREQRERQRRRVAAPDGAGDAAADGSAGAAAGAGRGDAKDDNDDGGEDDEDSDGSNA